MTVDELVRRRWAQSLRDLADFVEAHPALPLEEDNGVSVDLWIYDGANLRGDLARAAEALADKGKADKEVAGSVFYLRRHFGPHRLDVSTWRDRVCERVVTGTRGVVIPDPELVAKVPTIETTEDVVEWRCPDSILNPGAVA